MSSRKIIVEQSASDNIASIAWYIESKEMVATVEKLANAVYDYIVNLADNIKSYSICKTPRPANFRLQMYFLQKNITNSYTHNVLIIVKTLWGSKKKN